MKKILYVVLLLVQTNLCFSQDKEAFLKIWPNLISIDFPFTTVMVDRAMLVPGFDYRKTNSFDLTSADRETNWFLEFKDSGKSFQGRVTKRSIVPMESLELRETGSPKYTSIDGIIIVVPGNGSIYSVRTTYSIKDSFRFVWKYRLVEGVATKVPTALIPVNKDTAIRNEADIFSDIEMKDKIGSVTAGTKITVVGVEDSESMSEQKMKCLVKTSIGLVGWILEEQNSSVGSGYPKSNLEMFDSLGEVGW